MIYMTHNIEANFLVSRLGFCYSSLLCSQTDFIVMRLSTVAFQLAVFFIVFLQIYFCPINFFVCFSTLVIVYCEHNACNFQSVLGYHQ